MVCKTLVFIDKSYRNAFLKGNVEHQEGISYTNINRTRILHDEHKNKNKKKRFILHVSK